jgi:hypothetical protein
VDAVGQKLLEVAKKELGYTEKSGGYTKFGDWYAKNVDADHNVYFKNAPWCDMFISWAADQAGVVDSVGQFAATQQHAHWFKDEGAWGTTPEPGAIVFFDWSGNKDIDSISHVGIVLKVNGSKLTTIEANRENELQQGTRDTSSVAGYGYPAKVKVKAKTDEASYTPKHSAPTTPVPLSLVTTQPSTAQDTVASHASPAHHDLPVKEAALTGMIGVALLSVIAIGVAKVAAARVPAAVQAAPEVRVRKRGRHHRNNLTPVAPPVELPTEMTHYDLDDAESGTLMMPTISAAIAQEVEDREFWGRIAHLKEDDELNFWTDLHTSMTQSESSAHLAGRN